jgi:hypothetical protein
MAGTRPAILFLDDQQSSSLGSTPHILLPAGVTT